MGNATSAAPPMLKEDTVNQPKNETQRATSSTPLILKNDTGNHPKDENQQATSSAPHMLKTDEGQEFSSHPSSGGLIESVEKRHQEIKEHAETYPYVWGSYILVYGGFGLWLAYRGRKLFKTQDRVRKLEARLREVVEGEGSGHAAKVVEKLSTSSGKPSK